MCDMCVWHRFVSLVEGSNRQRCHQREGEMLCVVFYPIIPGAVVVLQKHEEEEEKKRAKNREKRTTLEIPTWSPTVVLTEPEHA